MHGGQTPAGCYEEHMGSGKVGSVCQPGTRCCEDSGERTGGGGWAGDGHTSLWLSLESSVLEM